MESSQNDAKILSLLSLAMKAGFITTGEDSCTDAIRTGKAHLVLVATDASNNTKKKFTNKTTSYKVPLISLFTKDAQSRAIGKDNRTTLALTNKGFAENIQKIIY